MVQGLKDMIVGEYTAALDGVSGCLLVDYTGVSAAEATELRRGLRHRDIRLRVIHNRLAARAFDEMGFGALKDLLDGPCALVYGGVDIPAVCRAIRDWMRENDNLTVRGGMMDGALLTPAEVRNLADIPPIEELYARIAGSIAAPLMHVVGAVQALHRQLAYALDQIRQQKEEQG